MPTTQRRLKISFFVASLTLAMPACSSMRASPNTASEALSLEQADQIKVNETRGIDVESRLGKPTVKIPIPKSNLEAWLYCDHAPCVQGRLTLHVNPTSGFVKEVFWNLKDGDREQDLMTTLNRYDRSSFSKKKVLVDYGCYLYTWEAYENPDIGVLVSYDDKKKLVTSVTRVDPKEKLALVHTDNTGRPRVTILSESKTATNP
jgi:hypothetical protein